MTSVSDYITHDYVPLSTARDILSSFDVNQPVSKWKPQCIWSLINVYVHHHHLIEYIAPNVVDRLMLAFNKNALPADVRITLDFFQQIVFCNDMSSDIFKPFTMYNVICAIVRCASNCINTDPRTRNLVQLYLTTIRARFSTVAYSTALKIVLFNMASFGIPDNTDSTVLIALAEEYDRRDPENVIHAIKTGRMVLIEYFFKKDFMESALGKTESYRWLLKYFTRAVTGSNYSLCVNFIETLVAAGKPACYVNEFVTKYLRMKNDLPHLLYDCDLKTFEYFYTRYSKIISPAVYIKNISPETFTMVRHLCNFKPYTLHLLHNIRITNPNEFNTIVGEDFKLYFTPQIFYKYANRPNRNDDECAVRLEIVNIALRFDARMSKPTLNLDIAFWKINRDYGFRMMVFDLWFNQYIDAEADDDNVRRAVFNAVRFACTTPLIDIQWSNIEKYLISKHFTEESAKDMLNIIMDCEHITREFIPVKILYTIQSKISVFDDDDYVKYLKCYTPIVQSWSSLWNNRLVDKFLSKLSIPRVMMAVIELKWVDDWYVICSEIARAKHRALTTAEPSVPKTAEPSAYARDIDYYKYCHHNLKDEPLFRGLYIGDHDYKYQMYETMLNGVFMSMINANRTGIAPNYTINMDIIYEIRMNIVSSIHEDKHWIKLYLLLFCEILNLYNRTIHSSIAIDTTKACDKLYNLSAVVPGSVQVEISMDRMIFAVNRNSEMKLAVQNSIKSTGLGDMYKDRSDRLSKLFDI